MGVQFNFFQKLDLPTELHQNCKEKISLFLHRSCVMSVLLVNTDDYVEISVFLSL